MRSRTRVAGALTALVLLLAACGEGDGDISVGATTTSSPAATSTTAGRASTSTLMPPTSDVDAISVESLFDGEGPREALVEGFVFIDEASTRLCATLMESLPPQCGWAWVVVANPDGLDVGLDEAQGISWTPSPVRIEATFDGERLLIEGGADPDPDANDTAIVEAFSAFAISGEGFENLRLAPKVGVGLAGRIVRTVEAADLADAAEWVIDEEGFRARTGPFSALDLVAGESTITVGPHARCVSPPVAAPEGFSQHRRVSLQPVGATSCLEWSSVDLFIDTDGRIAAITLDLFEP